ncbi:MAG: right-handed parallel beta-helix repeat-containing protein [Candidatus Eisenbacteria bacterium]
MRSLLATSGLPRVSLFSTVAALGLLLLPLCASAGVVIRVPLDATTIAEGLGIGTPGDTVRVDCETYYESDLTLPDGVVLESAGWDSGCVVIDGGRSGTILSCVGNTSGTVRNITFQRGTDTHGGAVYCSNATVTFEGCFFRHNDADTGGAIYCVNGNPEIQGCTFSHNVSTASGGAIALFQTGGTVGGCRFEYNEALIGGGAFSHLLNTTTAFTECEFYMNSATSWLEGGGGVYNGQQVATSFLHCRFEHNDALEGGGAYNAVKAQASFTGCGFESNVATSYGGAVYGYDDDATFSDCEFIYNESLGSGGGLYLNKSDIEMDFCTVYMNEAIAGGGIQAIDNSTLDLESCTIVENAVDVRAVGGAGLLLAGTTLATIDQTIIAFNRGGEGLKCQDSAAATLTCSDVSDNAGGDWIGCIAGQDLLDANIHADPFFCNVPAYILDLCEDSPCLGVNNDCGLTMGSWTWTCAPCGQPVETTSWGVIKGMYR